MGIEPTCRAVDARHNGFEDRGHHQVCKHSLDSEILRVRAEYIVL